MTTRPSPSTIIATFWWPNSTADLALVLRVRPRHIEGIWRKAKHEGILPKIDRPRGGFNAKELAAVMKPLVRAA